MSNSNRFKVDFLGIGAARSGTTWVAQCLGEHPQVCLPGIKEICFFSKRMKDGEQQYWQYLKGIGWYKNQFSGCGNEKIKGEFSVDYMYDLETPSLIEKHFPNVKLITCLRNPVDRACSHYWWDTANFKRGPDETFTFMKAVLKNKEYTEKGLYFKYLGEYYRLFPKENIYIILYDDIVGRPKKVIQDLYKFLEVDCSFTPPSLNKKINQAREAKFKFLARALQISAILEKLKLGFLMGHFNEWGLYHRMQIIYRRMNTRKLSYPPIKKNTRKRLQKVFEEDIEKLEELINRDLNLWKQ